MGCRSFGDQPGSKTARLFKSDPAQPGPGAFPAMTERIFSADGTGKYRRVLEHVSLVSPHPGPLPQGEGKLITVQLAFLGVPRSTGLLRPGVATRLGMLSFVSCSVD